MKAAKLNLQEKPLSWMKPAEYNPRQDLQPGDPEYERIRRSIEAFDYADPLIVNSDGTIIGGHQRYKVLLDLGYESADVVVVEKTKDEEKALNIALNKIGGDWDEEKLADLIGEIDLSSLDATLTGFDVDEIKEMIGTIKVPDNIDEDDYEAAPSEEPKARRGDVYKLGNHRLMCGDSTSEEDVRILVNGDSIQLALTDPPYGINAVKILGGVRQYRNRQLADAARPEAAEPSDSRGGVRERSAETIRHTSGKVGGQRALARKTVFLRRRSFRHGCIFLSKETKARILQKLIGIFQRTSRNIMLFLEEIISQTFFFLPGAGLSGIRTIPEILQMPNSLGLIMTEA